MTKLSDLHKKWMKDPAYRKEYDALEEEFALMAAVATARARSGLSQAQLAKRMKTTQSTIARLESGRGKPSTRTLDRFAKATGHRLKISFEPVRGKWHAIDLDFIGRTDRHDDGIIHCGDDIRDFDPHGPVSRSGS